MRARGGRLFWGSWDGVIIGATVIAVGVAAIDGNNADVDEATATVAAAVIGIAGTFAGHAAGHLSGKRKEPERQGKERPGHSLGDSEWGAVLVALALVLLTVLVGGFAYTLLPRVLSISAAAAATLCASVAGVAGARFAHRRSLSLADRVWAGRGLFALALAVSALLVIWHPLPIPPPDWAAFAATLVAVAGTFLAHSAGRRLTRTPNVTTP